MFGLCMPTGSTYLLLKNGKTRSFMMSDENNPRKHIMTNKHILMEIKAVGYKNVDAIVYQPNYRSHKNEVKIGMAEYYAEHGQELED